MKSIFLRTSLILLLLAATAAAVFLFRYYQAQTKANQVDLKIAVIGDHEGINPTFERILSHLESQDIDLLVDVADLTKAGERAEMESVLERLQTEPYPVEVVVGNNDLGPSSTPDDTTFKQVVRDPTYKSFNLEQAHIVLLDNANRGVGFSDEELDWLETDLAANTQPVVLLFMHRPINVPFEQVVGTDETKKSRQSNERFLSLAKQYEVDHIFTGHLETFLEYNADGIPLTVSGGAHDRPDQVGFGVSLPSTPHYLLITVEGEDIKVEKVLVEE